MLICGIDLLPFLRLRFSSESISKSKRLSSQKVNKKVRRHRVSRAKPTKYEVWPIIQQPGVLKICTRVPFITKMKGFCWAMYMFYITCSNCVFARHHCLCVGQCYKSDERTFCHYLKRLIPTHDLTASL